MFANNIEKSIFIETIFLALQKIALFNKIFVNWQQNMSSINWQQNGASCYCQIINFNSLF